jgi:transposase-like protein
MTRTFHHDSKMNNTRADYQRCADQGMTVKMCAEALGVTQSTVNSMTKKTGIQFQKAHRAQVDKYSECADQGMTINECAEFLGVNLKSVKNMVYRYNLTFRAKAGTTAIRATQAKMVTGLSISPAAINRYFKQRGQAAYVPSVGVAA